MSNDRGKHVNTDRNRKDGDNSSRSWTRGGGGNVAYYYRGSAVSWTNGGEYVEWSCTSK